MGCENGQDAVKSGAAEIVNGDVHLGPSPVVPGKCALTLNIVSHFKSQNSSLTVAFSKRRLHHSPVSLQGDHVPYLHRV